MLFINRPLAPDKKTAACLDDQSIKCNSLYNKLLEQANDLLTELKATGNPACAKILYDKRGLRDLVPSIKQAYPYLKSVYAAPLKNTALRLTESIHAYQESNKGKRAGKKTGWPRFRSWKKSWFSLFYDEPNKGYFIEDNILHLSLGLGEDRKRKSLPIPIVEAHVLKNLEIRNLRVVKENGIFSMVITVVRSVPEPKPIKRIIVFDPNHKNFAYGVDNQGRAIEIQAPHWLKRYDKRLDELKSAMDQCQKKSTLVPIFDDKEEVVGQRWLPSRRLKRLTIAYEKALAKRRELTKLFCYRLANILYSQYDLVAIGDYTPSGNGITRFMRRAMNNRSLIARFKEVVSWVATKSGKVFQEFPEKGTTRTCSCCQFVVDGGLDPSIREWTCPSCGVFHLRDENAACNGFKLVLRNLKKIGGDLLCPSVPSSGHAPIEERWAWRILSSGALVRCGGKIAEQSAPPRN